MCASQSEANDARDQGMARAVGDLGDHGDRPDAPPEVEQLLQGEQRHLHRHDLEGHDESEHEAGTPERDPDECVGRHRRECQADEDDRNGDHDRVDEEGPDALDERVATGEHLAVVVERDLVVGDAVHHPL